MRARVESERKREEEGWSQEQKLREEVDSLRELVSRTKAEAESYRTRITELEEEAAQKTTEQNEALGREVEELKEQLKQVESGDDDRLKSMRSQIESLTTDLSDALDMAARKELEAVEKGREMDQIRRSLDEANRQAETLRASCKELTAELERRPGDAAHLNGAVVHDDERREMIEQLQQAIRLIDRHLEG
jgi:DNA repair exonuclease SbcCD ATPase subunit